MTKRPLFFAACIFLCGILIGLDERILGGISGGIILLCGLVPLLIFGQRKRALLYLLISITILGATIPYASIRLRQFESQKSLAESQDRWQFCARVFSVKETNSGFCAILKDVSLFQGEVERTLETCLLYTEEEVGPASLLSGTAGLETIEKPRNYGEFDSCLYYKSLGIGLALTDGQIRKEIHRFSLSLYRSTIEEVYYSVFDKEDASVISAVVLGDKANLDQEQKDLFQKAGISHVLSVSGLHVSLIGMGIYKVLRKRKRNFWTCGLVAFVTLVFYLILTGSGVSTERAVIMFLPTVLARALGRKTDLFTSLGLAAVLLLTMNPFYVYNTGFLLSFLAILGVGIWTRKRDDIKKYGLDLAKERLAESLSVSWGIFITTLPVTLYSFFYISTYSLVTNLLVLPLMTPLVALAFAIGLLGIIFGNGFLPLSWLAFCEHWLLKLISAISGFMTGLPKSRLIIGRPSLMAILLFYLGMFLACLFIKRKGFRLPFALGLTFFLCLVEKSPQITFLDVGQGDGIVISTEKNKVILEDGGSSSASSVGRRRILPFLMASGYSGVDLWIVSHFDEDHYSGLAEILEEGYPIKTLLMTGQALQDSAACHVIDLAEEKGTQIMIMQKGDVLTIDEYRFTCLWPKKGEGFEDRNDASLGLLVETKDLKLLLCGDMPSEVEKTMVEENSIGRVDVYKCNHHGSNYSTSQELLEVIRPKLTVISCSLYNRYGHPGKETIGRLKESGTKISYTMYSGQISLKKRDNEYIIQEFLDNH